MKFPLDCGCEFEYCLPDYLTNPRFMIPNTPLPTNICEKHSKLLREEAYTKFKQKQEQEAKIFQEQYLSINKKEDDK